MNNTYFTELTHNLERAGFTISPEGNDRLSVELDGQPLCWATETSNSPGVILNSFQVRRKNEVS